jgi:hypothetical protein
MPSKKPCTGELVFVDGKQWCIGEKLSSKWKYSKLNKSERKKTKRRRTAKK